MVVLVLRCLKNCLILLVMLVLLWRWLIWLLVNYELVCWVIGLKVLFFFKEILVSFSM